MVSVSAQELSPNPLSISPKKALTGDQVSLSVVVKNTENQRGVYTVDFFVGEEKIGTQAGEIEKGAERVLSIPWLMPSTPVVVTVKENSFVGADGKKKELTNAIASFTVSPSTSREAFFSVYFQKTKRFLESVRLQWLTAVEKKRIELKEKIPKMPDRIGNVIEIAETGSLSSDSSDQATNEIFTQIAYYGYGILRTILVTPIIFYAIIILFSLGIIKFIFSRFI